MRRLHPDEANAWGKVMATVRPLRAARPAVVVPPVLTKQVEFPQRVKDVRRSVAPVALKPVSAARVAQNTLDASWDRKLGRGIVSPDSSIDLHGHTLASAHALLDQGLERAIRRGDRVLLLVTGKPPRPESERPHARGAIRAAVADWLGSSRHCDAIAAVRAAHPRHGGQGALYIILRRGREAG